MVMSVWPRFFAHPVYDTGVVINYFVIIFSESSH